MIKVKICGLLTYDEALMAAEAGADMLGFNFYRKSIRYIEPDAAHSICEQLRGTLGDRCPLLVGVFVNELVTHISRITNQVGLSFAQLSGDESDPVLQELRGLGYKAIRPMNLAMALDDVQYFAPFFPHDERAPSLLLDAFKTGEYGGTGEQVVDEIALSVKAKVPRLMLAGGLTPANVAARVAVVQPWGVDVASGVEMDDQPAHKDPVKVQAFIRSVKG